MTQVLQTFGKWDAYATLAVFKTSEILQSDNSET